ncbi:MAG TPA: alkaline phosphatase family protein [Pyrinomonadaceae bacterium]|jgi:predicted AlkP superfamily pyrophosphatase or phosphodiesterase
MRPTQIFRRPAAALLILLALLLAQTTPAVAQRRRAAAAPDPRAPADATRAVRPSALRRPRLVLLIAVDQFRYDYLERFGDLFGAGGLRRLLRDGASWAECNFDHVPTETAPGHATMMTGAWPSETGIVANDWYDRAEGKRVNNVQDDTVRPLGGGDREAASSPRNLLASTLGDQLKMATAGRARVVGVSSKNRGAILPAGRMADAAYWYSTQTGQFVSSTYYFDRLPDWVARFNAARPADKFFGAKWERLLPAAEYERRAGPDDTPWERGTDKRSYVFPHVLDGGLKEPGPGFYSALDYSPYSNDLVLSLAEAALANERLGEDEDTDVLTVSFSANDIVGHRYGPYSQEVMDITLRVDQQIERLLKAVDARVGLANTVVAFTADHGVAPSPEHATAMRLPGGRVRVTDVMTAVRNRIRARYGKPGERDTTEDYVQIFSNGHIYFNRAALDRDGVRQEEIERVAGEAALAVPGVSRYFTRTQLTTGAVPPADAVARRVLHGYNPRRSGDVVVIQESYKYLSDYTAIANHGTPYRYDTHVPLVIMGGGVVPGRYLQPSTPADIAPTLARILNVEPPSNATGRVLSEAFK